MGERRSAERFEIVAAVACNVAGRSDRSVAYDISTDGCMIQATTAFYRAGDDIALTFSPELSVTGKVVWVKHRNAGVQFSRPLPRPVVTDICRNYAPSWSEPLTEGHCLPRPKFRPEAETRLEFQKNYAGAFVADRAAVAEWTEAERLAEILQGVLSAGLLAYCAVLFLFT